MTPKAPHAILYASAVALVAMGLGGWLSWYGILSALAGIIFLVLALVWIRTDYKQLLYSPAGLFYSFLLLNCCFVPVLWDLGYARPWPEVRQHAASAAVAGICVAFIATIAMLVAIRTSRPRTGIRVICPPNRLRLFLILSAGAGIVGLGLVSFVVGGFETLVSSLTARRSVLESTGPLLILINLPAVAAVLAVYAGSRSRSVIGLSALNAALYMFCCLSMGNRFQSLVVVLALLVAYDRRHGIKNVVVVVCLLPVIPLSVLYLYVVRQGLSSGVAAGQITTQSGPEFLRSVLHPFVDGGLDVLRTLSAAFYNSDLFVLRTDTIVGSLVGIVPRSIWPTKPAGSSIDFSVEYFPLSWSRGTGVPPSLPAELIFCFGLAGGLLLLAVATYSLTRLSERLRESTSIGPALIYPFIAADSIVLLKAGFDSFSKLAFIHLCAVALVVAVVKSGVQSYRVNHADTNTEGTCDTSATAYRQDRDRSVTYPLSARDSAAKGSHGVVAPTGADDVSRTGCSRTDRVPSSARR